MLNEEKDSRSKMKKIERRTYTVQDVETRADDDGKLRLSGYAAKFDSPSLPLPFIETIAQGAFRKTLTEIPDVRLLVNHDGLPLARTKNGTMSLTEDDIGLRFDAELADTQEAKDLHALIARGDVDQMSFAFRVIRQKWNEDRTMRTLTEVSLADGDVSVVTYPAYPATSVEAREHLKNAIEAVKEGREISGDSLIVLKTIFEDLSEGHDYVMRSVELMAQLLGNQEVNMEDVVEDSDYMDEEEDKNIKRAVDTVGSFVSWGSSGGTARGKIVRVVRNGELNVPGTDFSITAEEDDPAVLIQVYSKVRDGYEPSDTRVGHKASTLTLIDSLPKPSPEEAGRKISLRLAKAIINNTK